MVWAGARLGVPFRVFWVGAPRWLYTPVLHRAGLGRASSTCPTFWEPAAPRSSILLCSSAGCSTPPGGVVYALKRPNPSPPWFGFHEVFHALTLAGFITQYIAVSLVLYGAR